MGTQIKKETKVILTFNFTTFKWCQTVEITEDEREVTIDISPESAMKLLNGLEHKAELTYPGVTFHIK